MEKYVKQVRQWLFPDRCVFCQEPIEIGEKGGNCCRKCSEDVKIIDGRYCEKCGKLHDDISRLCFDCSKKPHKFEQGRGMYVYERQVKKSLFGLKFFNHTWVGKEYGLMMADFYKEQCLDWDIDVVIPVPLHLLRRLQRGYNQAEIIGEYLCSKAELKMESKVLKRARATEPQKDLTDEHRHRNMQKAFKVSHAGRIKGKNILLIDDIYTTGATIDGCAKVLRESGADKVYFLTVAIGKGF